MIHYYLVYCIFFFHVSARQMGRSNEPRSVLAFLSLSLYLLNEIENCDIVKDLRKEVYFI